MQEIHIEYDKKQVLQALRYHFITRKEIKILLILVNVFAIASAVLLALKMIQPLSFLVFSGLWLLLMLAIWRILPMSIFNKSRTFQDDFSLRFQANGIELVNEKGVQQWHWSQFAHFVETPYFFHLYFDERSFFLIPKDAFPDLPAQQDARAILKEHIRFK